MEPSFLDKILQKPEAYRRKVAFGLTAVLGIFIFAGWLLVMNYTLKESAKTNVSPAGSSAEDIKKNLPSLKEEESFKTELMKEGQNPAQQNEGFDSLINKEENKSGEFKVIER